MTIHLTATNVRKSFGPTVLEDIDLSASAGTLTAIRGRAGSGRSTLARCLAGGYRVDAGTVELSVAQGSHRLTDVGPRSLSWIRQHYLAIFDGAIPTAPSQTCAHVVQRRANSTAEEAVQALDRLNIAQFADVPVGRLRPPQRETVALAAALLDPASVVILDTPESAGPDEVITQWARQLADDGKAVIATTNEASLLADSAHHTATLTKGTLQWDSTESKTSRSYQETVSRP